jgi:hypothetical protein
MMSQNTHLQNFNIPLANGYRVTVYLHTHCEFSLSSLLFFSSPYFFIAFPSRFHSNTFLSHKFSIINSITRFPLSICRHSCSSSSSPFSSSSSFFYFFILLVVTNLSSVTYSIRQYNLSPPFSTILL